MQFSSSRKGHLTTVCTGLRLSTFLDMILEQANLPEKLQEVYERLQNKRAQERQALRSDALRQPGQGPRAARLEHAVGITAVDGIRFSITLQGQKRLLPIADLSALPFFVFLVPYLRGPVIAAGYSIDRRSKFVCLYRQALVSDLGVLTGRLLCKETIKAGPGSPAKGDIVGSYVCVRFREDGRLVEFFGEVLFFVAVRVVCVDSHKRNCGSITMIVINIAGAGHCECPIQHLRLAFVSWRHFDKRDDGRIILKSTCYDGAEVGDCLVAVSRIEEQVSLAPHGPGRWLVLRKPR